MNLAYGWLKRCGIAQGPLGKTCFLIPIQKNANENFMGIWPLHPLSQDSTFLAPRYLCLMRDVQLVLTVVSLMPNFSWISALVWLIVIVPVWPRLAYLVIYVEKFFDSEMAINCGLNCLFHICFRLVFWIHSWSEAAMEDVIGYLLKSSSINFPGIWAPWTDAISVCHSWSQLIYSRKSPKMKHFFQKKFHSTTPSPKARSSTQFDIFKTMYPNMRTAHGWCWKYASFLYGYVDRVFGWVKGNVHSGPFWTWFWIRIGPV